MRAISSALISSRMIQPTRKTPRYWRPDVAGAASAFAPRGYVSHELRQRRSSIRARMVIDFDWAIHCSRVVPDNDVVCAA